MLQSLNYHYLSFRNKRKWAPFKKSLNEIYLEKIPHGKTLLILGGSACSILSPNFLNKFDQVLIYDKDPLAPVFFYLHHGFKIPHKYFLEDAFGFDGKSLNIKRTQEILNKHSPDFVLLSNVVGQLPVFYKKFFKTKSYKEWSQELVQELNRFSWLSFHDVFSFKNLKQEVPEIIDILKEDSLDDIMVRYKVRQTVYDHMTLDQPWPRPSKCYRWEITPASIHYIEVCSKF